MINRTKPYIESLSRDEAKEKDTSTFSVRFSRSDEKERHLRVSRTKKVEGGVAGMVKV